MKKLWWISMAVVLLAAMVLAGCAGAKTEEAQDGAYYGEADYPGAPEAAPQESAVKADEGENGSSGGAGDVLDYDNSVLQPSVNRKIVYYGTIEAQTTNYKQDYDAILAKLDELGGYVQDTSSYGTPPEDWQDTGRTAQMTLRVPNDKFSEFMKYLGSLGETVSTSMSGEDISLQYFNSEQQLKTLRTREERLQELLTQAATMEDIIELETALSDVSNQIQSLETELRNYDSLIDFSTVTITLLEVNVIDKVTPSEKTLGERISSGFYSVLNFLADFGEGLLVFLVAGSPILIPLALILVFIIWRVRKSRRRRAEQTAHNAFIPPTGAYYDPMTGRPYVTPQSGPAEKAPEGKKEDGKDEK